MATSFNIEKPPTAFEDQVAFVEQLRGTPGVNQADVRRLDSAIASGNRAQFQTFFGNAIRDISAGTKDARDKLSSELTAFANKTDFSTLSPEQAQRELSVLSGSQETGDRLNSIGRNIGFLKGVGLDVSGFEQQQSELQQRLQMSGTDLAGTQFAPGLIEAERAQARPTPLDNVIPAADFVKEPEVTVGGTPNIMSGAPSPIFVGEDGTSLFFIPPGTNQPQKISDPAQLQQLAQQGLIQVNQQRMPLAEAGQFLQNQTAGGQAPAPGAGGATGSPESTPNGLLGGIPSPGSTDEPGGAQGLFQKYVGQPIAAFNEQIQAAQNEILGFSFSDFGEFRRSLEQTSGVNNILNELAVVDMNLAELLDIERRVPATTLERARGTEITQGTLDRQRTIELGKLAAATAPLTDLKRVLGDDLDRRTDLIDESVDLQKEMEGHKLETLGYALDFAVQNQSVASTMATNMFNAAISDFEYGQNLLEQKRKEARDDAQRNQDLMIDFYKAQGFVIDPMTGELAETLDRQIKLNKAASGGGGGVKKISLSESEKAFQNAQGILTGVLDIKDLPQDERTPTSLALDVIAKSDKGVFGPVLPGSQDEFIRSLSGSASDARRAQIELGGSSAQLARAQEILGANVVQDTGWLGGKKDTYSLTKGTNTTEVMNAIINQTGLSPADAKALIEVTIPSKK
jgi:hypothetical protein